MAEAGGWHVIRPEADRVWILDQRALPGAVRYLECTGGDDVVAAIQTLAVRGAPLIGIAAVYGLWLYGAAAARTRLRAGLRAGATKLKAARPTAVNLAWAVDRVLAKLDRMGGVDEAALLNIIRIEADQMVGEDVAQNVAIGELGAQLFPNPCRLLTHCNTGALATGGHGTALGVIRSLHAAHRLISVFVDETRPLLQGARLTAWELQADRIPATVIVDGAAASLMQAGTIDGVVVGADRIAANGDTANKIGTLMLAVAARHFGVPFIVAAPWSTVDLATPNGSAIPIEERDSAEVLTVLGHPVAPVGMQAQNPAFDVTPAELITAIVTERGVLRSPYAENLARLA